ncbi:MAG: phosphate ABC transporter phosphate-binding protein, partial [Clostridia bacterium]|nr:phosphate ABC transporter phosphate-binding protein [Clostridia bacterium]
MKKMISLLALILVIVATFSGCGTTKEGGNGSVATDGSTSMNKVIGGLGEAFENETGISVTYNATGSGAGIQAVL